MIDLLITLGIWLYFTLGWVLLFFPRVLAAYFFAKDREASFQRLNHLFYRGFFTFAGILMPGLTIRVSKEAAAVRSSVIVCSHRSYLDPLLLTSLFERHKTIVKHTFFRVPIFGWMIRTSGYIPSTSDENLASLMIRQVEGMGDFLASGGNLFIFPEGTRGRTRRVGRFGKGAFRIAKQRKAPISVLSITGADKLFTPGRFRFHTASPSPIRIRLIKTFTPDYDGESFSLSNLMDEVAELFERS
ncbi:MAG: 1-acyl-sn-glycerol-3-phosphate acyltransferase [Desulfobacterales bacterium]|nr:1-acyl-sn-glycerol-3-phosphate acyltransferase [Desulfobacterales bacterium]